MTWPRLVTVKLTPAEAAALAFVAAQFKGSADLATATAKVSAAAGQGK